MSTTTEETKVTTEPTGADAFTAARAAVGKGDETPATDDTSTPTPPAEDTAKVADQTTETTDPDTLLTEEELAALPPKERAKAEKWQAKLTQKAQKLSATEKEFDEWKPLIEGLKTNPREALAQVAKQLGLTVAEAKEIQDTPAEDLPEELKFLKPVFDQREKALEAKIRAELDPLKKAHETTVLNAIASETEATEKAFEAQHSDYRKLEPQMLELAKKFIPVSGAMTDYEYLEHLYGVVKAKQAQAEKTKEIVARINNAAKVSEEKTSGIPNERVSMKIPDSSAQLDSKELMRLAYEAAKRGEIWEK